MKRLKRAAMIGAASAGIALGSVGVAHAYPSGDPVASGCAVNTQTVWQQTYFGAGTVEVRYSAKCGTNWLRITGAGGRASEAGIYSPYSGWQYGMSYSNSPSSYYTPQVYAPGSTCVTFRVKMQNTSGTLTDTGNKQLC